MNTRKNSDLDWLAFLYVADEMDDPQRATFETQLADDQLARDAVVNAIKLGRSLHGVYEGQTTSPVAEWATSGTGKRQSFKLTARHWASIAALFALVIAGAWSVLPTGGMGEMRPGNQSDEPFGTLAVVWAETLDAEEIEIAETEIELSVDEPLIDMQSVGWMAVALSDIEFSNIGANE